MWKRTKIVAIYEYKINISVNFELVSLELPLVLF